MMTRRILPLLLCALLALAFLPGLPARADDLEGELAEKSGAGELYGALDDETRELLALAGGEEDGVLSRLSGEGILQVLSQVLRDRLLGPLKALAALAAVIVLTRLAGCFEEGETGGTAAFVGVLACSAVTVVPLLELLRSAQAAVEGASVFLMTSVPVYAGLLASSGDLAAGGSYSFLVLAAGNAIPLLSSLLIFPLLRVFLALALVSGTSRTGLGSLAGSVYSFGKWMLVLAVTLFSGILSVQTVLNAQIDAAANKTVRLLASTAVPIVGGAFGDAVSAIQNSIRVVKSGAGAFGVLAALCIFAPILTETALWSAVCSLGQLLCELFEAPALGSFLKLCGSAAKMILAVLAAVCTVCVVSAAVLLLASG